VPVHGPRNGATAPVPRRSAKHPSSADAMGSARRMEDRIATEGWILLGLFVQARGGARPPGLQKGNDAGALLVGYRGRRHRGKRLGRYARAERPSARAVRDRRNRLLTRSPRADHDGRYALAKRPIRRPTEDHVITTAGLDGRHTDCAAEECEHHSGRKPPPGPAGT
jgi:hypothetical protein